MAKKYKYRKHYKYKDKYIDAYGNTVSELADCMKRKELAVDRGADAARRALRFAPYAEYCIETYKNNVTDGTKKTIVSAVRRINTYIGSMDLDVITIRDCQQILNDMQGMATSYIARVHQALSFVFRTAVIEGYLTKSPAAHLVTPKGTKTHFRALTPFEREHVLKVAKTDRRFYLFLLMLLCGCRPQEASGVKGKDIILKDGRPLLHIRGTKTALSDRFVPLPKDLYLIIKNVPADEFVCPTRHGNRQTRDKVRRTWLFFKHYLDISMGAKTYRNAIVESVVADDLVPYCLRHEYCTDLARKGIDLRTAQRLMGHSTIRMTAEIYTNLQSAEIIESAAVLFE